MDSLKAYYLDQLGIERFVEKTRTVNLKNLDQLAAEVSVCTRCPLHQSRTQTVFSRGNPKASLMIIGEAPGFYEDKQGKPFVGKAGSLLNCMLASIGYSEDQVYIANVLKCRPPNNRDPLKEEINQCCDFLSQQINQVKPNLILAVGRFAGQFLMNTPQTLAKMRNRLHQYKDIPFFVSYHPAYLLRNPVDKKKAYLDLIQVKNFLSNL